MPTDNPPPPPADPDTVRLRIDGADAEVPSTGTLLDVLREHVGDHSAKDGCSPQGQCGCCTVLVDGAPRVACVTPIRRVRGRDITTASSLPGVDAWADAFCAAGASQCGFCTPGIIVRLAGLHARKPDASHDDVEQALLAHLCRCTGWRTILDAWDRFGEVSDPARDLEAASRRAGIEGGAPQRVSPAVAMGHGGFADDTAPDGSLVAVLDAEGRWTLGQSVAQARSMAGKVQGRRTTEDARPPLEVPDGDWAVTLCTSWVEPAYLEPDASWATPRSGQNEGVGGAPGAATPLANGGAFGGKAASETPDVATRLADEAGRAVRVLYSREDTVRRGPKRPPVAAGLRADGTGLVRVARTPGVVEAIHVALPKVDVEEVDVAGPPTSLAIRAAGWAEAVALAAALDPPTDGWVGPVQRDGGGTAWAHIGRDGTIDVRVDAGDPLDEIVLRSYCIGAAHQAASWVTSEALTVDDDGVVHDLTIRSFGILRAVDTPPIGVEIQPSNRPPAPVSDAVFAAVAAAVWVHQGAPASWPTGKRLRA